MCVLATAMKSCLPLLMPALTGLLRQRGVCFGMSAGAEWDCVLQVDLSPSHNANLNLNHTLLQPFLLNGDIVLLEQSCACVHKGFRGFPHDTQQGHVHWHCGYRPCKHASTHTRRTKNNIWISIKKKLSICVVYTQHVELHIKATWWLFLQKKTHVPWKKHNHMILTTSLPSNVSIDFCQTLCKHCSYAQTPLKRLFLLYTTKGSFKHMHTNSSKCLKRTSWCKTNPQRAL